MVKTFNEKLNDMLYKNVVTGELLTEYRAHAEQMVKDMSVVLDKPVDVIIAEMGKSYTDLAYELHAGVKNGYTVEKQTELIKGVLELAAKFKS